MASCVSLLITPAAVVSARGKAALMPTLGGSVPLYLFTDILKLPAIGIPIANHDNNQHSANENLRLQNLWDGIETLAARLTMGENHCQGENSQ